MYSYSHENSITYHFLCYCLKVPTNSLRDFGLAARLRLWKVAPGGVNSLPPGLDNPAGCPHFPQHDYDGGILRRPSAFLPSPASARRSPGGAPFGALRAG